MYLVDKVSLHQCIPLAIVAMSGRQWSLEQGVLECVGGIRSHMVPELKSPPNRVRLGCHVNMACPLPHQSLSLEEDHVFGVPPVLPCVVAEGRQGLPSSFLY